MLPEIFHLWHTNKLKVSQFRNGFFSVFTFFQKMNKNKSTSCKVEFVFWKKSGLEKSFRIYLTFRTCLNSYNKYEGVVFYLFLISVLRKNWKSVQSLLRPQIITSTNNYGTHHWKKVFLRILNRKRRARKVCNNKRKFIIITDLLK